MTKPPRSNIPLTPSFVIAAASALVGVTEVGGNNRGQMVERFLKLTHVPAGAPWCAAFVSYVGYWTHYDHWVKATSWPLPTTASCQELGSFARRREVLEKKPVEGDVFLMFNVMEARFSHTGFVVHVDRTIPRENGSCWYECRTIEGNTSAGSGGTADTVAARTRTFYPEAGDRFIRWVALDERGEAGKPGKAA